MPQTGIKPVNFAWLSLQSAHSNHYATTLPRRYLYSFGLLLL